MLTGGIVNGIMGLFGGSNKAEQRQYQHEKEMMDLQYKYNMQAAAQGQEYAKEMNRINFEQQNQMFDKQAEWNSAKMQKERLKEAGLNPGLMYGLGGEGGSSVSSGGGSGAAVQGVSNTGTQAVMMGLQAKSIESQIALNNAQASKINAETEKTETDTEKTKADTKVSIVNADNIVEATKLIKEQQLSEQSKRDLNEAEKNYKIRVTELQDALERLTNAKETESWYLSRSIEMETYKLSKEAEKIMKEIDGLEVDNDVKRKTADMIVEQTRMNIKSTMQSILESQSRVTINEEQKTLVGKTIEDLISQIETRKGQLEINEKEVIGKLDIMREQIGLGKIKMDIEKDRLLVDTVLGLMDAASKIVKPGS
nr:MAG TPA: DNA pilot protein [Microviridae sp.]